MKLDNLKKYLDSLGKEVVAGARAKLRAAGKGGGALDKSLNFDIVEDGKFIDIQWKMLPYGEFVDKGVKGAGGEIKSGKYEGSWGGRRYYKTWQGNRKDSPYKFGSGKSGGSIYSGIAKFLQKKGLDAKLKYPIVNVLWIKGIHGISFFQEPLGLSRLTYEEDFAKALKQDILETLAENENFIIT